MQQVELLALGAEACAWDAAEVQFQPASVLGWSQQTPAPVLCGAHLHLSEVAIAAAILLQPILGYTLI